MKKWLSIIISLVLIFGVFVISVNATEVETISNTTAPTITPDLIYQPIAEDTEIVSPMTLPSIFESVEGLKGLFHIKNLESNMYVDIHGPDTDMIHQWEYHTGLQEIWLIAELNNSGYYCLISPYSMKYLGISNSNTGEDNIVQYTSLNDNALWNIERSTRYTAQYVFEPKNASGKMLSVVNSICGSELQLKDFASGRKHLWTLYEHGVYYDGQGNAKTLQNMYIQNIETSRFAGPYGPYLEEGTSIHQWEFGPYDQFNWVFEYHASDFSYSIKNLYTQKYLGYSSNGDEYGLYIEQYSSNTAENTRWRLYRHNENIIFSPKSSVPFSKAMSVDPPYNDYGSRLKLVTYTDDSNYKDEWKLFTVYQYGGSIDDYWYSDDDTAGYWNRTVKVYTEKLDSPANFDFSGGVSEAKSQWSSALGINFSTTLLKSSSNMEFYGGSLEAIAQKLNCSIADISWSGLTNWEYYATNTNIVNLDNGNELKYVIEYEKAYVYVTSSGGTETNILQTFIHEMGHAVGFCGHPIEGGNVMNKFNGVTILTYNEKRHLQEIYENFVD